FFELLTHRRTVDLPVLTPEIAPGLVRGKQDPILADAATFDFCHQPPSAETNGPRRVAIDAESLLHPIEELRDELDVTTHPAAEMHEIDLDPLAVLFDERDEVGDVGATGGAGLACD